jgi:hypothetical protein
MEADVGLTLVAPDAGRELFAPPADALVRAAQQLAEAGPRAETAPAAWSYPLARLACHQDGAATRQPVFVVGTFHAASFFGSLPTSKAPISHLKPA